MIRKIGKNRILCWKDTEAVVQIDSLYRGEKAN